jgi:hypothetical protein
VGLDRLLAEEQLGSDLPIGLAVDDEARHLELAFGQRVDAVFVCPAGARAPMRSVTELPQLPLRALTEADRAAGIERLRCALEHGDGLVALPSLGQRSARKRA